MAEVQDDSTMNAKGSCSLCGLPVNGVDGMEAHQTVHTTEEWERHNLDWYLLIGFDPEKRNQSAIDDILLNRGELDV